MSSRKGLFQKEGSVFNHYFSKDILGSTLPETNIALQNTTGPKRKRSSSNHWLSGSIYVSFRQCVTVFFGKRSDMDHEWPWWICKDTWIFLVDTKMTCLWVNKSLFVGVSVPWMIKVVLFEQCPRLRWMKMGCWIASPQTMVKCISRCGEICLVSNDFLPWPDPRDWSEKWSAQSFWKGCFLDIQWVPDRRFQKYKRRISYYSRTESRR